LVGKIGDIALNQQTSTSHRRYISLAGFASLYTHTVVRHSPCLPPLKHFRHRYDLPTSLAHWVDFEGMLLNCSEGQPFQQAPGVGIGPDTKEARVQAHACPDTTRLNR